MESFANHAVVVTYERVKVVPDVPNRTHPITSEHRPTSRFPTMAGANTRFKITTRGRI